MKQNPMQRELLQFAEDLDVRQFRAVAHGLGINVRKRENQAAQSPNFSPINFASSTAPQAPAASGLLPAMPLPETAGSAAVQLQRPNLNLQPAASHNSLLNVGQAMLRLLAILLVDSFVVALSILVALVAAGAALGVRDGAPAADMSLLGFVIAPVKWLAGFSPVQILAGFYGIFLVYALTLRLIAGGTLGQALLRRRRDSQPSALEAETV